MEKEQLMRRKKFIINCAYFAIILGISIFFMRHAIYAVMPFVIALLVSFVLRPAVLALNKKFKIPTKISSIVLVVIIYLLIAFLLVIASISLIDYVQDACRKLPNYFNNELVPAIGNLNEIISVFFKHNKIEFDMGKVLASIGGSVSELSTTILGITGSIAVSVPGIIVNTIICIVSTYFFTVDMGVFGNFFDKRLSKRTMNIIRNTRSHFGKTIWNYVRSYALIVIITFTELIIGFLFIGIKNSVIVAAIIAIFDILPIVGCGTVLLPWIVISLVKGDTTMAFGLLIVYAVITVIRNILEPKIVGQHVGLHPLVTLMAMIIGSYVFGPLGLLGLPIALVIIKDMYEEGIFIREEENNDTDNSAINETSIIKTME